MSTKSIVVFFGCVLFVYFLQDEMSLHCQQREKDASAYEKQLESEKSNNKRMQADLQKELQCAFNEINQLNGLMAGRVPKGWSVFYRCNFSYLK